MPLNKVQCPCQNYNEPFMERDRNILLEQYSKIRDQCPALKLVHPDETWEEIKKYELDRAVHDSIFLGAFMNGYLNKLTRFIHDFLLQDGDNERNTSTVDYRKSFNEKWLFEKTKKGQDEKAEILLRNRQAKKFAGKFYELLFASWLTQLCFSIEHLEAWGEKEGVPICDILALKVEERFIIEVKFIGDNPDEFNQKGISNSRAGLCCPDNYLSYIGKIVSDAAIQLERNCGQLPKYEGKRIAAILLDGSTPSYGLITLKSNYVTNILNDLSLDKLDGIWIFGSDNEYGFSNLFSKGIDFETIKSS